MNLLPGLFFQIGIINPCENSLQGILYPTKLDEDYIARNLLGEKERLPFDRDGMTYKQLSLFDDTGEFSFRQAAGG